MGYCLKYLKEGWNRKEGRGNKDFKNGGASWVKGGCLKKGEGLEPPYELCTLDTCYFIALNSALGAW